jgi:hypothetical protein
VKIPLFVLALIGRLCWSMIRFYFWSFFLPIRMVEFVLEATIRIAMSFVGLLVGKGNGKSRMKN